MWLWKLISLKVCRVSWQAGDPESLRWSSSPNLKAGKPGELMVYFQSEGWQAWYTGWTHVSVQDWRQEEANIPVWRQSGRRNSFLLGWGSALLFYAGLQLIGWGPPTLRRAICFTQSTELNVSLITHTHTHTHTTGSEEPWLIHTPSIYFFPSWFFFHLTLYSRDQFSAI